MNGIIVPQMAVKKYEKEPLQQFGVIYSTIKSVAQDTKTRLMHRPTTHEPYMEIIKVLQKYVCMCVSTHLLKL